jgi:hypothetical protein
MYLVSTSMMAPKIGGDDKQEPQNTEDRWRSLFHLCKKSNNKEEDA